MRWFLTSAAVLAALTLGGCRPAADTNSKDNEAAAAPVVAAPAPVAVAAAAAEGAAAGTNRTDRPGVRSEPGTAPREIEEARSGPSGWDGRHRGEGPARRPDSRAEGQRTRPETGQVRCPPAPSPARRPPG